MNAPLNKMLNMYFFTVLSNTLMYKNVIQMVKTASAIVVSCA